MDEPISIQETPQANETVSEQEEWVEPRLAAHGDAREITQSSKKPIGTSDGGTQSNIV
ncbi:MAG TPA: hypothetical protein VFD70_15065 [Anaerolineae bacterium]|nr:hypothetical protein [Anaerolineae bacterium]